MEVADLVTDPLGVDRMDFKDELKLESGLEDTSMEIMDVATDSLTVDELDIKPIVKLEPTLMGTACGEETMEGELETDPLAPDIKPLVIQDPDFKFQARTKAEIQARIFKCSDCNETFPKRHFRDIHRRNKCDTWKRYGRPTFGRESSDIDHLFEHAGTSSEGLHANGSGKTSDRLPGFNDSEIVPFDFNDCPPIKAGLNPFKFSTDDLGPMHFGSYTYPSGHLRCQSITRIMAGAIGLRLIMFTVGSSIAAAGGVMVALSSASASSLIIRGWGVASDITGIVSGTMEDWIPEASWDLDWILLVMGLAVICVGLGLRKVTRRKMFCNRPFPCIADSQTLEEHESAREKGFLVNNGERRCPVWHEINHNGKLIFGVDQEITGDDISTPICTIRRYIHQNHTNIKKIYLVTGIHGDMLGLNWSPGGRYFAKKLCQRTFTYEDFWNLAHLIRPTPGSDKPVVKIVDVIKKQIDRNEFNKILDNERYHVILGYCFSRNEAALIKSCNLPRITPYTSYYSEYVANNYINAESHMIDPNVLDYRLGMMDIRDRYYARENVD